VEGERVRKTVRAVFIVLATAFVYALANRITETHLRISPDLYLVFPPSGLGVAAAVLFGFPAVLGVGLGSFLTPWNARGWGEAVFSSITVLEVAIPWLVFRIARRRGSFRRRDWEMRTPRGRLTFFGVGVAANTGLCAVLGILVSYSLGGAHGEPFLKDVLFRWTGSSTAVMMLGWPLVELTVGLDRWGRLARARVRHPALVLALTARRGLSPRARKIIAAVMTCWVIATAVILLAGLRLTAGSAIFGPAIMIAAYLFGFRGGLVAGSLFGWIGIGSALEGAIAHPDAIIGVSLSAFDRVALGVLTGGLFDANRRLIWRLDRGFASLKKDLQYVAGVLTAAVESRDAYTEGHMQRVAIHSVRIAKALGLSDEEVETVRLAALLHDVGKIGVPDRILFDAAPIASEDVALMRSHVELGARIAANAAILSHTAPVIRAHHERWDGLTEGPFAGYPDGLKGEEIPLGARIISVADAYDTMTTNRPYRKAPGRERAIACLLEERGKQFDPDVVDAFVEILGEGRRERLSGVFSISTLVKRGTGRREPVGSSGSPDVNA
jgi:putative nucleotidyltransferase with HDIG domain